MAARKIGRYAVFGELAAGGMATVYVGRLAGAAGFSRRVAIKSLHAQYAKDPDFLAMFLDEARLSGRVQHPNVVQILDVISTTTELWEAAQGAGLNAQPASGVTAPPAPAEPAVSAETWKSFSEQPASTVGPRLKPDGGALVLLRPVTEKGRPTLCEFGPGFEIEDNELERVRDWFYALAEVVLDAGGDLLPG